MGVWRDCDLGQYVRGWHCENFARCESSGANCGSHRWHCSLCSADICGVCHRASPWNEQHRFISINIDIDAAFPEVESDSGEENECCQFGLRPLCSTEIQPVLARRRQWDDAEGSERTISDADIESLPP